MHNLPKITATTTEIGKTKTQKKAVIKWCWYHQSNNCHRDRNTEIHTSKSTFHPKKKKKK